MSTYKTILAGYGKMDVTPFAPVHLGSFNNGMQRLSDYVKENDSLVATTLALTDEEGDTLLFIVTDLSWGHINWSRKIRQIVFEKYGIPGENVHLGGVHNHSGPDWYSEALETPANQAYFDYWLCGVMSSVYIALQDRKPANIFVGNSETKGVGFVRRYFREDGNLAGGGYQKYYVPSNSPIVRPESEADEQIQMVRFVRDGAKDILLAQWQNHACHISGSRMCASDWIGPMRRMVEQELGCHYFYMQGCAGNLSTSSRILSNMELGCRPSEDQVGYLVADAVIRAYHRADTFRPVNGGKVRAIQQTFSEPEKEWEGELDTLSFGDVSVVTFPVEMFDTSGKQIKAATPFEMTLLMDYSNGIHGYCPDKDAYEHGGYEVSSRGVSGTAERIVKTHLDALQQLYDADHGK